MNALSGLTFKDVPMGDKERIIQLALLPNVVALLPNIVEKTPNNGRTVFEVDNLLLKWSGDRHFHMKMRVDIDLRAEAKGRFKAKDRDFHDAVGVKLTPMDGGDYPSWDIRMFEDDFRKLADQLGIFYSYVEPEDKQKNKVAQITKKHMGLT